MRACLAIAAVLLIGCEKPTFTRVQTEVFSVSCTFSSCHSTPGAQGLDLTPSAYARIVNVPATGFDGGTLVVPGKPDDSYLFQKLVEDRPRAGRQMPEGGEPLEAERRELIREWIAAGAQND